LLTVLELPIFLELLTSVGLGVKISYLWIINTMLLVLLPSARLSGKYSIVFALKAKWYWVGLFMDDDKDAPGAGSNAMLKIMMQLLEKKTVVKTVT
jgi:hypothetical protein